MSEPRRWLHCTTTWRGDRWVAARKCPTIIGRSEPRTPRLCVAETVAQCFAARLFADGPVYVYRTVRPRRGIKPVKVWDSVITGEHWLIPPVELEWTRTIPASESWEAQRWLANLIHRESRAPTALERAYSYADAIRVLGGSGFDRRFSRRMVAYFEDKWLNGSS